MINKPSRDDFCLQVFHIRFHQKHSIKLLALFLRLLKFGTMPWTRTFFWWFGNSFFIIVKQKLKLIVQIYCVCFKEKKEKTTNLKSFNWNLGKTKKNLKSFTFNLYLIRIIHPFCKKSSLPTFFLLNSNNLLALFVVRIESPV